MHNHRLCLGKRARWYRRPPPPPPDPEKVAKASARTAHLQLVDPPVGNWRRWAKKKYVPKR